MDVKRFFLYAILVAALALAGCSSNGNGGTAGGMMPGGGNGDDMVDLETLMCTGDASDYFYKDNCMDPNPPAPPPPPTAEAKAEAARISQTIDNADGDDVTKEASTGAVNALTGVILDDVRTSDALHSSARPGKGVETVDTGVEAPLYNALVAMPGGLETEPVLSMAGDTFMAGDTPGVDDPSVTMSGFTLANQFEEMMSSEDMTGEGMTGDDMGMTGDDMTGGDMGMMDRFTSKKYTRTNTVDGAEWMDTITVYDNIEAAGSVTWSAYYATARHGLDDPADAEGVLTVNGTEFTEDQSALFAADMLPSAIGSQTITYVADDPDTPEDESTRMFKGTFNGVSGTFACGTYGLDVATVCTATGTNGRLTALTGQNARWTFRPDDVESVVSGVGMHDDDYLAFGFWVQQRGTGDDAIHRLGTFSRGSMPFDNSPDNPNNPNAAIAALMGTATYSGMAAGQYAVLTDRADDGMAGEPTGSGEFTADVTLKAKFRSGATANINDFTISGMVENFMDANSGEIMDANGNSITDAWSLQLDRAEFAARTPTNPSGTLDVNTDITAGSYRHFFSGHTSGMAGGTMGKWTGMFYGPTDQAGAHPTGVAGEFIGYFQSGHVLGAFGAELDEPMMGSQP